MSQYSEVISQVALQPCPCAQHGHSAPRAVLATCRLNDPHLPPLASGSPALLEWAGQTLVRVRLQWVSLPAWIRDSYYPGPSFLENFLLSLPLPPTSPPQDSIAQSLGNSIYQFLCSLPWRFTIYIIVYCKGSDWSYDNKNLLSFV